MGYRQRGASWEVNVAYKGAREFSTVATEQEAKDKEVELKAKLIQEHRKKNGGETVPTPVPTKSITWTLGVAIDKTFEVRWAGTKSESFYRTKAKRLVEHFGREKPLGEIDTDAVDGLTKALKAKGNSQVTINHALVTLSMLFKIAHQRGGVPFKPVFGIKQVVRGRVRWVTEVEEKILLGLFTQWNKPDIVDWTIVMVDTGMRPSETKKMTAAWVDLPNNSVHVLESKTKAGIRTIPMTARVRKVLERRVKVFKGALFPYSWQVYQHAWERARTDMGLDAEKDFVAYCLRHTFGTRLAQRGVRIDAIQRLMGHEDPKQTMVYAKLGAAQFVEAMSVLEPKGGGDTESSSKASCGMPQPATPVPQKRVASATSATAPEHVSYPNF